MSWHRQHRFFRLTGGDNRTLAETVRNRHRLLPGVDDERGELPIETEIQVCAQERERRPDVASAIIGDQACECAGAQVKFMVAERRRHEAHRVKHQNIRASGTLSPQHIAETRVVARREKRAGDIGVPGSDDNRVRLFGFERVQYGGEAGGIVERFDAAFEVGCVEELQRKAGGGVLGKGGVAWD